MKPIIAVYTNLYPLPFESGRASFNRQQFHYLSQYYKLNIKVPVAWTLLLKSKLGLKCSDVVQAENLNIHYFRYFFVPKVARWSYGLTQFFSALHLLPKLTGVNKPELILATWAYPDGFAAIVLGKLLKVPVIIKVHGSDINENTLLWGVQPQVSWVLKNAAGVLCVSRDLADKVAKLGANRLTTEVIYNGVDMSKFFPKNQNECRRKLDLVSHSNIILYVGNLKYAKGCVDLLEAFALFAKSNKDTYLIYVGAGQCSNSIKQEAEKLAIGEQVILTGSKAHEELPLWMGAADVVTLPSHNEGVPNVLLEAMACAKPVVASKVGGIPEIIPEYAGFLVEKQNKQSLAEALQKALVIKWDEQRIMHHAQQFTWEKNISQLTKLIDTHRKLL